MNVDTLRKILDMAFDEAYAITDAKITNPVLKFILEDAEKTLKTLIDQPGFLEGLLGKLKAAGTV